MKRVGMLQLILPGSIRSKKNSKIATMVGGKNVPRRAIIIPSKAYQKWEKEVRGAVIVQELDKVGIIDYDIHVRAHFYYKGPQPDLSGCCESVGDCLEGIIWENDGLIKSWDGSRLEHCKDDPRTLVWVEKYHG